MKKTPQHVHFRCGTVHINSSLKKIGVSYNIKPFLLKKETAHNEIFENT